jgi:hypothetical protein
LAIMKLLGTVPCALRSEWARILAVVRTWVTSKLFPALDRSQLRLIEFLLRKLPYVYEHRLVTVV